MVLVKKLKFFYLLCFSKVDREKRFGDVLAKRKPLKTIKRSVYEKRKIRIFPNGLVHGFGQKFKISLTLKFEIVLTFRFLQNTPRKKYLVTFSLEKKPFYVI